MDDTKYVFMTDSREKKRIANSAQKRVRSSRKCTLPYEMLKGKERKAYMAPSEVEVFSLRPMSIKEFRKLPKDKQVEVLKWYGEKYGWNPAGVADALNVSWQTAKLILVEHEMVNQFKTLWAKTTVEQKAKFQDNRRKLLQERYKPAERVAEQVAERAVEAVESAVQGKDNQPHPEAENPVQKVLEAQNNVFTIQMHAVKDCEPLKRQLHGIANSLEDGKTYKVVLSIAEVAAVTETKKCESNVVDA